FEEWIASCQGEYYITKVSVRNNEWQNMNWSEFDVILHVAGIVHNSVKKQDHIYYDVNSDLTYAIAQKAKQDGINQFIFLSTMSVYGKSIGEINKDTSKQPNDLYGKSKL